MIADNTSAARVAIGTAGVAPREVDLRDVECTFTVDGEVTGTATGAALLGSPADCVALLVRHLARTGRGLEAGWLVMAGAPLDARPFGLGHGRHGQLQPLRRGDGAGRVTRIWEDRACPW